MRYSWVNGLVKAMLTQRSYDGCIIDTPDPRDERASKLFSALSAGQTRLLYVDGLKKSFAGTTSFANPRSSSLVSVDLRPVASPIEDQFQTSACVANAAVGALEMLRIIAGVPHKDLSRFFLYYNSRIRHSAQGVDKGTQIRHAMASMTLDGVTGEDMWRYDVSKVNQRPSWMAYRAAYFNKLAGYYRINESALYAEVKTALRASHPVVFGVEVDTAFQAVGSDGWYHARGGNILGRHAMLIVGYDDARGCYIVRNSWGIGYGDRGYCYIPYDVLTAMKPVDVWVPTITVLT